MKRKAKKQKPPLSSARLRTAFPSDTAGSYTGIALDNSDEVPEQDADDL